MKKLDYVRVLFTNDWNGNELKDPNAILVYIQESPSNEFMKNLEYLGGFGAYGGDYKAVLSNLAKLGIYSVKISEGRKSHYKEGEDYDREYRVVSGNY